MCCCSVAKLCPILCSTRDCSMPGLPNLRYVPEFAQTPGIESVIPFNHLILCGPILLLPSVFPRIRSCPVSQLFASGGQSIGASASPSVFPMNIQGWFPLSLIVWLVCSPCCPKDSQESFPAPHFESINSSVLNFVIQLWHLYMTIRKTIALTIQTFVGKVRYLLLNTSSRFVIALLLRHRCF